LLFFTDSTFSTTSQFTTMTTARAEEEPIKIKIPFPAKIMGLENEL
jgi:hypothetical protein